MYPNLKAELARRGLTLENVACSLGKTVAAVSNKMRGVVPFTYDETVKIKTDVLKTDLPLETIFEKSR